MAGRIRKWIAVLAALVLVAGVVPSAGASTESGEDARDPVAPTVDLLLLRPVALLTFVTGTAVFAVSVPLLLVTRPQDMGTPFEHLVVRPAKYVWVDPIGVH